MTEIQRVKKVINWLIYKEVAENDRALAELMGYTKSSFSQIVNGKVPLSEKFVKKLCALDENINEVWVLEGKEDIFKSNLNSEKDLSIPANVWNVIQQQAESLLARDRQIDELVSILKKQGREWEKIAAHREDNATSAAVG